MVYLLVLPHAAGETIPPPPQKISTTVVLPEEIKCETWDENFSRFEVKRTVHDLSNYYPDTCCFWCCHPFETNPVGKPYYYDYRTYTFHCVGHYCSYNCVLADTQRLPGDADQLMLTRMLVRSTKGRSRGLVPAPPRETLEMFGGIWDIVSFRKEFCHDIYTKVTHAPVIHHVHQAVRTAKEITSRKGFESIHKQQQEVALVKQKTFKQAHVKKKSLFRFTNLALDH